MNSKCLCLISCSLMITQVNPKLIKFWVFIAKPNSDPIEVSGRIPANCHTQNVTCIEHYLNAVAASILLSRACWNFSGWKFPAGSVNQDTRILQHTYLFCRKCWTFHKTSKSQITENFYQVIVENVDWDVVLRQIPQVTFHSFNAL